jgi:hypothetical protein
MTSYPATLTVKKLIEMRILTIKIYIAFLLRMSQILHIPKFIFGVSHTLNARLLGKHPDEVDLTM